MTTYASRRLRRRRATDIALLIIDHAGFAVLAFTALIAIVVAPVYW